MSEKNDENLSNENGQKPSKPKWWKPLWILTAISMVGSGVFTYFFLHGEFVRIIIYEIIFSLVLGAAYYFRVRPSIKVNKLVYILFGITPIGFGLSMLYALICGITNFGQFIVSIKPFGSWLQIGIIIGLLTIGGFIGNWIGKKRGYRLPLSPY
jgi:hypothetical protein